MVCLFKVVARNSAKGTDDSASDAPGPLSKTMPCLSVCCRETKHLVRLLTAQVGPLVARWAISI